MKTTPEGGTVPEDKDVIRIEMNYMMDAEREAMIVGCSTLVLVYELTVEVCPEVVMN